MASTEEIDVVITWVDDRDPQWQRARRQFQAEEAYLQARTEPYAFRNFGLLRYLLRGIELHMPFVRRVHLVTAGQVPDWLDSCCRKLHLVSHEDIFPDSSYLPNFNSAAIESCFAAINGLTENFIYFNDDFFVIADSAVERFLRRGLPSEHFQLDTYESPDARFVAAKAFANNLLRERYFSFLRVYQNWTKIFHWRYGLRGIAKNALNLALRRTPFAFRHGPGSLSLRAYQRAERDFPEQLEQTRRNRFRGTQDLLPYFYRGISLLHGEFYPTRFNDILFVQLRSERQVETALEKLSQGNYRFVCWNDGADLSDDEFKLVQAKLENYFSNKFPDPSRFEKVS